MSTRRTRSHRTQSSIATVAVLIGSGVLLLGGCTKPLFPRGESRTQFDRYDLARNAHQPSYIEDEFGRRTPNLKGRLAPR